MSSMTPSASHATTPHQHKDAVIVVPTILDSELSVMFDDAQTRQPITRILKIGLGAVIVGAPDSLKRQFVVAGRLPYAVCWRGRLPVSAKALNDLCYLVIKGGSNGSPLLERLVFWLGLVSVVRCLVVVDF